MTRYVIDPGPGGEGAERPAHGVVDLVVLLTA